MYSLATALTGFSTMGVLFNGTGLPKTILVTLLGAQMSVAGWPLLGALRHRPQATKELVVNYGTISLGSAFIGGLLYALHIPERYAPGDFFFF